MMRYIDYLNFDFKLHVTNKSRNSNSRKLTETVHFDGILMLIIEKLNVQNYSYPQLIRTSIVNSITFVFYYSF